MVVIAPWEGIHVGHRRRPWSLVICTIFVCVVSEYSSQREILKKYSKRDWGGAFAFMSAGPFIRVMLVGVEWKQFCKFIQQEGIVLYLDI